MSGLFDELSDVIAVHAKNHVEHWRVSVRELRYVTRTEGTWCIVKAVLPVGVDPEYASAWDFGTGTPRDGETQDPARALRWYLAEVRSMIYGTRNPIWETT